jgi:hypothetical protein
MAIPLNRPFHHHSSSFGSAAIGSEKKNRPQGGFKIALVSNSTGKA